MQKLGERAVLMRLSIGLPGENRQDPSLTGEVKREHGLGGAAGKWIKNLFPPEALKAIKALDNAARSYHGAVTLPFDAGIGILPAALIKEHGDRMRQFKGEREVLVDEFLTKAQAWVEWAIKEHNGTFQPDLYPGCTNRTNNPTVPNMTALMLGNDFALDVDVFKQAMKEKFSFRTEPLPVPDSAHFVNTVADLLGTDLQSIDARVKDASHEAAQELMRRMIAPVKAMADKLSEAPKNDKKDIVFRDTLVTNLKEIAGLAPKLNLSGDPAIDAFAKEIGNLTLHDADALRKNKGTRSTVAAGAADLLKRLEAYKI